MSDDILPPPSPLFSRSQSCITDEGACLFVPTLGNSLSCSLSHKLTGNLRAGHTSSNPFVETTLCYALSYITKVSKQHSQKSIESARLTILADNDYYSAPNTAATDAAHQPPPAGSTSRFARFPTSLRDAHKTGLGSSAAVVTSLTAALLTHYLDTSVFDLATDLGRQTLHNLSQIAHCAAQGKIGSGFDVATAIYGSCFYRRFSPAILSGLGEPGEPGFASKLQHFVEGTQDASFKWDTEVVKQGVSIPAGVAIRICDVDCGSQTVSMVKQVLAWRAREKDAAKELWDELQRRNGHLAAVLQEDRKDAIPGALRAIRELLKKMGEASGAQIEPDSQTELLDALEGVEGVYGGVVPGAGGFDAVALLMNDDKETTDRVEEFLAAWTEAKGGRVTLLDVKGEMAGVRKEELATYKGWIN